MNNAFISEVDLEKSIKKLYMFKNQLDVSTENVLKSFKNINLEFETKNKSKFLEKCEEEQLKSRTMNHILNEDILIIEKMLERYRRTTKEVADQFKHII